MGVGTRHLKRILLLGVLPLCGCVDRQLTIKTEPDEAVVWLNDEEIGVTPVTVSFSWYGDYNVRVTKPGYTSLQTHRELKAPWYDYFPFDFFVQILYPWWIEDHCEWAFDLKASEPADRQELIDHALSLENRFLDQQVQE